MYSIKSHAYTHSGSHDETHLCFFYFASKSDFSDCLSCSVLTLYSRFHHLHNQCFFILMAYPQHFLAASRSNVSLPQPPIRSISETLSSSTPPTKISPDQPVSQTDQELTYTFTCTVCRTEHDPPPHTFGLESRIVCTDCWRWIHSLSVCWRCGEVVYRKTDTVSFGWC